MRVDSRAGARARGWEVGGKKIHAFIYQKLWIRLPVLFFVLTITTDFLRLQIIAVVGYFFSSCSISEVTEEGAGKPE